MRFMQHPHKQKNIFNEGLKLLKPLLHVKLENVAMANAIYSVCWFWYVMSRCNFDLRPVDLESSWYMKRHVIKVFTKLERNWAICGWIIHDFAIFVCKRYVALYLDLWFVDLELLLQVGRDIVHLMGIHCEAAGQSGL